MPKELLMQIDITPKRRIILTNYNDNIRITTLYQDHEDATPVMENMLELERDTAIMLALNILDKADANNMLLQKHRPK